MIDYNFPPKQKFPLAIKIDQLKKYWMRKIEVKIKMYN